LVRADSDRIRPRSLGPARRYGMGWCAHLDVRAALHRHLSVGYGRTVKTANAK
jgi:hypothetical protein